MHWLRCSSSSSGFSMALCCSAEFYLGCSTRTTSWPFLWKSCLAEGAGICSHLVFLRRLRMVFVLDQAPVPEWFFWCLKIWIRLLEKRLRFAWEKESKAWPSPWVYSDSCLRSTWVTFRFWVLQPLPSRVLFLVFKSLSAKVSRGTSAAQTSCNTRPILLCLGNFKRAEFSLKKSWALMEEKNHHFTQEDCSHSSINCLQTWNSGVPCCRMGQQCWMNWQMLRCCVISGSWAARTLLLSTHSFGSKPKELVCQKSAPHPSPDGINGALRCQDLPGAFTLPLVGANSLHSLQELAVGDGTYRLMMR